MDIEDVNIMLDIEYDKCIELVKNQSINYNGLLILDSFLTQIGKGILLSKRQEDVLMNMEKWYTYDMREIDKKYVGYVYFMTMGKEVCGKVPIKIGYSKNPVKRLKQFKTGNPDIKLQTTVRTFPYMERLLHQYLADRRYKGEWFLIDGFIGSPSLSRYLEDMVKIVMYKQKINTTEELRKVMLAKKY